MDAGGEQEALVRKPGELISSPAAASTVSSLFLSEPLIFFCRAETPAPLSTKDLRSKRHSPAGGKAGLVNCRCQPGLRKFMVCHTVLGLCHENFSKDTT